MAQIKIGHTQKYVYHTDVKRGRLYIDARGRTVFFTSYRSVTTFSPEGVLHTNVRADGGGVYWPLTEAPRGTTVTITQD